MTRALVRVVVDFRYLVRSFYWMIRIARYGIAGGYTKGFITWIAPRPVIQ